MLDRLKNTLQRDNWRLRSITRGYESKKTLEEIVKERSTPAGRGLSPQKMMFKNKLNLTANAIHLFEVQKFEDEMHYETVEDEVTNRWWHLNHSEKSMLQMDKRAGYKLDKDNLTPAPKLSKSRDICKSVLATVLEDALKEFESVRSLTSKQVDPQNIPELEVKAFDSLHDTIPLKSFIDQTEPISSQIRPKAPDLNTPLYSNAKKARIDTRPYTESQFRDIKEQHILSSHITNNPQSYIEARLRQELVSGDNHCHLTSKPGQ